MIAFRLGPLPCTVFISVECLHRLGHNDQFCCERFNFSLSYFSQLSSKFIISKVLASLSDDRKSIAGLLCELCFLRDGSFWLPTSFVTTDEVNSLISYACRM